MMEGYQPVIMFTQARVYAYFGLTCIAIYSKVERSQLFFYRMSHILSRASRCTRSALISE